MHWYVHVCSHGNSLLALRDLYTVRPQFLYDSPAVLCWECGAGWLVGGRLDVVWLALRSSWLSACLLANFPCVVLPAAVAVQIKDAVRDGLRAVKNVIDDKAVVLGAGAFEVAAAQHLRDTVKKQVGQGHWLYRLNRNL